MALLTCIHDSLSSTGTGHQRLSLGLYMDKLCTFAYHARCAV